MISQMRIFKPVESVILMFAWIVLFIGWLNTSADAKIRFLALLWILAGYYFFRDPTGAATMRGAVKWYLILAKIKSTPRLPSFMVGFSMIVFRLAFWVFFPVHQGVSFVLTFIQRPAQREIWRQATQLHIDALENEAQRWHNDHLDPSVEEMAERMRRTVEGESDE